MVGAVDEFFFLKIWMKEALTFVSYDALTLENNKSIVEWYFYFLLGHLQELKNTMNNYIFYYLT